MIATNQGRSQRATRWGAGVFHRSTIALTTIGVTVLTLGVPTAARDASPTRQGLGAASRAPDVFHVTLETTKGTVVLEVTRDWAPNGTDRFVELVRSHYYDDCRIFRVIKDRWAQFGIAGDPAVAQLWRTRTFPDDPFIPAHSNVRGTIAFAFAVPNGRTTQVFINTRDNSPTHDKEPFVPFGRVVTGMDVVDGWYSDYGEQSGGGIRAAHQDPAFAGGNAFFDRSFPNLDRIRRATVEPITITASGDSAR